MTTLSNNPWLPDDEGVLPDEPVGLFKPRRRRPKRRLAKTNSHRVEKEKK